MDMSALVYPVVNASPEISGFERHSQAKGLKVIRNKVHRAITSLHHSADNQGRAGSRHLAVSLPQPVRAHNVEEARLILKRNKGNPLSGVRTLTVGHNAGNEYSMALFFLPKVRNAHNVPLLRSGRRNSVG